ncbi:MAG: peroxiredoxin [Bacteroidetes bacterium]|nr:peroxiredoxin [Bacteroidota bacterium]MDA0874009.1 peroxiredoxin [Bacteroidota bacterium]
MSTLDNMPEAGAKAPEFSGITQDGSTVSLADFRGRKVALYFYPQDDTSVCTKQACSLRDGFPDLTKWDIVVLGVSPDDEASHRAFIAKYDLPFTLIADTDRNIMAKYSTYGPKNMYGKVVQGVRRTTFLIDEKGVIAKVIKRPKNTDHASEIVRGFGLVE